MIPVLRDDSKIIGFLGDALSCVVTEERNGIFELELTYPSSSPMFPYLQIDKVIEAKPNDTANNQLFRIYEISTPLDGIVTVYAEHVSYLLNSMPIANISRQTLNATTAISYILGRANRIIGSEGHSFTQRVSDITTSKKFEIVAATARAALGGMEGSVLDVYGGEFEFDNYYLKLHKARGSDKGVIIAYGKNLTDVKMTINMEDCYTGIYPYYYKDGTYLQLRDETIEVANISGIAPRLLLMDFTPLFEDEDLVDEAVLLGKTLNWLDENDINTPTCSLTVSFQNLWQSPEYASFAALEKVSLCDIVTVRHEGLGIDIKSKVIKTTYDTLAERYIKIELGSARSNFTDTMRATNEKIDAVKKYNAEFHSQITQEYLDAIENASNLITGNEGGYVVITPTELPQEILIMNRPSINSATKLWRWNLSGLGYSKTGYNGSYKTAITMDGQIVADFITTGTLTANIIRAGVLAATDWSSYFDLEDGSLVSSNANITGGYISIGSGNYRTVIQDGSIEQYLNSASKIIGGLVPVGLNSTYWEALYCGSNYKGVAIGIMSTSGSLTTIGEFDSNHVYLNKATDISGKLIVSGAIEASGNITFDSYLYDGRGYQVVGENNNLVFGNGNYSLGFPTFIEGGDVYLRNNTSGSVIIQRGSTNRYAFSYTGWKFPDVDSSYVSRDTINTAGGFVLSANSGDNAMYLVATSIRLFGNAYLNFSASSGTIPLVVNNKGKITVSSSSMRYKENITDKISRNLNPRRLYGLPIVQYNYKAECESIELVHGTQIGILAEDVSEIYPNACIYNHEGEPESWQDRIMIPAMLKLIQEQKAEIDEIKSMLATLSIKQKEDLYGTEN